MTVEKVDQDSLLTAEELWEMPEVLGKRFELVRGELVEMPGAGGLHGLLVMALLRLLDPFVMARNLGRVFADGVGYIINRNPDIVRVPDVSFISNARIPAGGISEQFIPIAPDLAVEIVSPGDRAEEVYGKVLEYLQAGARLVWVFWPKYRSVTVYTAAGEVFQRREGDALDGDDVIPGFEVSVAEIFDAVS